MTLKVCHKRVVLIPGILRAQAINRGALKEVMIDGVIKKSLNLNIKKSGIWQT